MLVRLVMGGGGAGPSATGYDEHDPVDRHRDVLEAWADLDVPGSKDARAVLAESDADGER